jgi:hypothetical protein
VYRDKSEQIEYLRAWQKRNPEYVRKYWKANREHYREVRRAWTARIAGALASKKWRAKHPERARAHKLVRAALVKRTLKKLPCEVCNSPTAEAHHPVIPVL